MTNMAKILAMLATAFPHRELNKATIALYEEMLSDLPLVALEAAARDHIANSQYFPTIAELRKRATELTQDNRLPDVGVAWELVLREVSRTGFYGSPQFDCPTVAAVVKQIGWRDICCSENADVLRSQFTRFYNELKGRTERQEQLHPVVRQLIGGAGIGRLQLVQGGRPGSLPPGEL